MLLFFTGSDWCGWCNKIEEEAIDTPEFAEIAGNKFIFVKLDFPLYANQDPQVKAQNKALQQKFDVRGFPTLVIIDPVQNQSIGTTGYRPGGGKAFADHLLKMVNDYSGYKQKIGALDKSKFSGTELKQLYEKSKELRLTNDSTRIVKKGMSSDEAHFFLVERYRFLADEGQIHGKECAALREKIMAHDPLNEHHLQYQIAVIDFETNCDEMDGVNSPTEQAVAPLITYMEKFGGKDKEHLWRLQLLVSQVYLDKNEMTKALKYAQASYEAAPACVQSELSRAISSIRSQIHSSL
jgi:protein disulfide-isomerase